MIINNKKKKGTYRNGVMNGVWIEKGE